MGLTAVPPRLFAPRLLLLSRGLLMSRLRLGSGGLLSGGRLLSRGSAVPRFPARTAFPAVPAVPAVIAVVRFRLDLFAAPGNFLADQLFDRGQRLGIRRRHQRDGGTRAPGAAGAADAMHVILGMVRHVEIENVAHLGNVEPARGHVARDQKRDLAVAEGLERIGARTLVHVAVQRDRGKSVAHQRAVQLRHLGLAIAEDDAVLQVFGAADEPAQHLALLFRIAGGGNQRLRGGGDGAGGAGDFHPHRIGQEGADQALDFRRHSGREKKRLPRERHHFADLLDVGDEAHVEHAIRFVDDQNLDAGEQQLPALVLIEEAAGGRDQDIDAAGELHVLVVVGYAADQERQIELMIDAVFGEVILDLRRELARGLENQRARHARPRPAFFQDGEHGQHECGGLAGAGLRDAQDVAPRQHVRDGLFLDRRGLGVASGSDGGEHLVAQA